MRQPSRAELREWYGKGGKLAEAGFRDLETMPGDGLLSDRGSGIHDYYRKGRIDAAEAVARHEEAAAVHETKLTVLTLHRFRSHRDRDTWKLHVDGQLWNHDGLRPEAARQLRMSRKQAQKTIARIEAEWAADKVNESKEERAWGVRKLTATADLGTLTSLGMLIALKARRRSPTRWSRSSATTRSDLRPRPRARTGC